MRILFVLLLLIGIGCGGDGGGSDDATVVASSTPTVTPPPSATATPAPASPAATPSPAASPVAFAAGGSVTVTSDDGGFQWSTEPVLPVGNAVDFADRSTGWVASTTGAGGEIRHTTDGGKSWRLQSEELGYPRPTFHDVDAVDRARAVVAGRETVFVGSTEQPGPPAMFFTRDGGTTWQRSELSGFDAEAFAQVEMWSVCVTAAGHGVAAGRQLASPTSPGLLLVTQDAGATWRPPTAASTTVRPIEVDCAGEQDFWVTDDLRHIQHSPDGGASWRDIATTLPGDGALQAVDFDGPSEGYVLTSAFHRLEVFHTTDGGAHWTVHDIVGSTGLIEVFAAMDFDGAHGVVVAQDLHPLYPPRSSFGVAFATADGGATWTETVFPEPINALWDVVLLP